ncbi:sensor histidine kinase [Priestia filamentosa]|uniref:histidine kinase n=1 Tax=Priestia filamentosa TaxID=1402861 RepID=A0A1X7FQ26_9BACI|nr:sensor histidine kinase [Priestia filamentosa]AKO94630.1 histidine kinase [Priestia filamentosa]MDT3764938.1 sensor histidine kinase [Priestia filamentosa]OXS66654.1 two-component sensor histidine kinase [Priestia filamentosa]RJS66261.1 sensor histidine kinase [Priestia filamentosa]WCM15531.1 sensor histidine kinase [Priestia filamentosa]
MKRRYRVFQKVTGLSPYIWSVFAILPFYFVFQSSSTNEVIAGVVLNILFFLFYRLAFISKGWPVYLWTFLLISISIALTSIFTYIYFAFYFAFFLAYFIGHVQNRLIFFTLYGVHLISTFISVNYNTIMTEEVYLRQLPFIFIITLSVVVLPFSIYNRRQRDRLEEKLEDANKRIAELSKQEERQRIARDLHDTLGQKLSLIGLKSDLARKLIQKDPEQAKTEIKDVQQTARTALNEVRKMVSQMRGIKLKEELIRVEQILTAADIDLVVEERLDVTTISPLLENILSMCLKEAVTNVVKHSGASLCIIETWKTIDESGITIRDNGKGFDTHKRAVKGHGLIGMEERLEFVNGQLEMDMESGATIRIKVPNIVKQEEKGRVR